MAVNEKEMVSVIIPVYNCEKWIGRCIDSVCAQTYSNLEIIVVNDGSTDNTLRVITRLCRKDSRIKYITVRNQGSAKARKTGMKYAAGNLVTFVDADDHIDSGMYEAMVNALQESGADIVECGCRKMNQAGRVLQELGLREANITGSRNCLRHYMEQRNCRNYMCNKLYRKELFENIEVPRLSFSEDYYINAILHSRAENKRIISRVFYNYMIYPGQCTNYLHMGIKRIDGVRAGTMLADYFTGDREMRTLAGVYACRYALDIAEYVQRKEPGERKRFLAVLRRELLAALVRISPGTLRETEQKTVVWQSFLLALPGFRFFDIKWLMQ